MHCNGALSASGYYTVSQSVVLTSTLYTVRLSIVVYTPRNVGSVFIRYSKLLWRPWQVAFYVATDYLCSWLSCHVPLLQCNRLDQVCTLSAETCGRQCHPALHPLVQIWRPTIKIVDTLWTNFVMCGFSSQTYCIRPLVSIPRTISVSVSLTFAVHVVYVVDASTPHWLLNCDYDDDRHHHHLN